MFFGTSRFLESAALQSPAVLYTVLVAEWDQAHACRSGRRGRSAGP